MGVFEKTLVQLSMTNKVYIHNGERQITHHMWLQVVVLYDLGSHHLLLLVSFTTNKRSSHVNNTIDHLCML